MKGCVGLCCADFSISSVADGLATVPRLLGPLKDEAAASPNSASPLATSAPVASVFVNFVCKGACLCFVCVAFACEDGVFWLCEMCVEAVDALSIGSVMGGTETVRVVRPGRCCSIQLRSKMLA